MRGGHVKKRSPKVGSGRRPGLVQVGRRIRELRHARRVSLTDLAGQAGLSQGYLSQIERDLATPSTTVLSRLSEVLGVPLGHFFEGLAERLPENFVVRRTQRRILLYPGSPVRNELLVPDLRGKLEAVYFRARAGMRSPNYKHDGEDFCYVLKGRLRIAVGPDTFLLNAGDSVSFPSHTLHYWEAVGRSTEVLWVATPPSW
jgi:transcriptional regulator with XRE-family HTH domain